MSKYLKAVVKNEVRCRIREYMGGRKMTSSGWTSVSGSGKGIDQMAVHDITFAHEEFGDLEQIHLNVSRFTDSGKWAAVGWYKLRSKATHAGMVVIKKGLSDDDAAKKAAEQWANKIIGKWRGKGRSRESVQEAGNVGTALDAYLEKLKLLSRDVSPLVRDISQLKGRPEVKGNSVLAEEIQAVWTAVFEAQGQLSHARSRIERAKRAI